MPALTPSGFENFPNSLCSYVVTNFFRFWFGHLPIAFTPDSEVGASDRGNPVLPNLCSSVRICGEKGFLRVPLCPLWFKVLVFGLANCGANLSALGKSIEIVETTHCGSLCRADVGGCVFV
jgi:hypothetical protein